MRRFSTILFALCLVVVLVTSIVEASADNRLKGVRGRTARGGRRLEDKKGLKEVPTKCKKAPKEDPKEDPKKKADSKKDKGEEEEELCEEDHEVSHRHESDVGDELSVNDGDEVKEARFGSTGESASSSNLNMELDCDAIANDDGPTSTSSVSFMAEIDILKDTDVSMGSIYDDVQNELQQSVAPKIAGCSSSSSSSSSSEIVNVDFGQLKFDNSGCESDLKSSRNGVCLASSVPVDVYYTGSQPPSSLKSKVASAIDEHSWNIDGMLDASEVRKVTQTGSSGASSTSSTSSTSGATSDGEESEGGVPPAAFGGIAAVAALALGGGGYYYMNNSGDDAAKGEVETDPEDTDDEQKKIPEANATPVY